MTVKNDAITTLHDLLNYDARRFLSAEAQLKKILPAWISFSTSLKLKNVLHRYEEYVQQHIARMESFFIDEKISSVEVTNQVMKAMIEDTKEKIQNCEDSEVKDAAILACVQTINHFKISFYGTATAFANALNVKKHAGLFHESEVNEKQIDDRLTQLAEHDINIIAKAPILIPS